MTVAERSAARSSTPTRASFIAGWISARRNRRPTIAARVPHHLIDVRNPDQSLDVAEFAQMARAAIDDIAARGRNPLVVGGSGLYLRVIRGGIFRGPAASPEIRDRLAKIAAEQRRRASASASCARSIPRRRIESASTTCTESCARSKSSAHRRNDHGASAAASIRRPRLRHSDHRRRSRTQKALRGYRRALRCDGRGGARRGSARAGRGRILAREAAAQYDWIQARSRRFCAAR